MAGHTIKLQSSDGEIFDVDASILSQSQLLEGFSEGGENCIIPLPNINSAILKKVIEWAIHHKDDPSQSEDNENRAKTENCISDWDQNFLKVDQGTLFELILAANYLNIKALLDVTCTTVATSIKGKSPDEIRKIFNISTQFTPEEEVQIKKENEWCSEQ